MNIPTLLQDYRYVQQPKTVVPDAALGRTAELRRKFESRFAELSEVRLRCPASEAHVEILRRVAGVYKLSRDVLDLYLVADGETSSGFFAPELEFLRISYVEKLLEANREALSMGLLPEILSESVPVFRDSLGNQIVIMVGSDELNGRVAFVDMEKSTVRIISESLVRLICRLVHMKKANEGSSEVKCPGDFRNLTSTELDLANKIESGLEGP